MTSIKSMTDVAYDVMSKKKRSITFAKLWQEVVERTNPSDQDEAIAQFYSDLTLDGRFASLKDNKWDLKERHTFEETFVNLNELNVDTDEEEMEEEVSEEEGEENSKTEEEY